MGSPFHGEAAISPKAGYPGSGRDCKPAMTCPALAQLGRADIGGGPRPSGFFGLSVPT
jgi:hypothetical protein